MKIRIATLSLLLSIFPVVAEDATDPFAVVESEVQNEQPENFPATLAEAHEQLEEQLPVEELKKIDAMKTEDEMIDYHFGSGMGMRNTWGLWGDSPLALHLRELGFTHADDMSSVILETFWCKRHGKEFRIKERAEYYRAYWSENKWPDKEAVDPDDKSEVVWSRGYEAEGRLHRTIYIGRSKKTGRLLAFENPTGVYVPDEKLLESLSNNAHTSQFTSGTTPDPLPEIKANKMLR
jgi:hypothetical protein